MNLELIGKRVNVRTIIKNNWQSKHELFNGVIKSIKKIGISNVYHIIKDSKSTFNGLGSGVYYDTVYKIDIIN